MYQKLRLRISLVGLLALLTLPVAAQQPTPPKPPTTQTLGLVASLATHKTQLEALAAALLTHEKVTPEVRAAFQQDYLRAQTETNRILLQLGADMRADNRVRLFRQLNEVPARTASSLSGKAATYQEILNELYRFDGEVYTYYSYQLNEADKSAGSKAFVAGSTLALTAAELAAGIIESARAAREAKVGSLVALLDSLRLKPLRDLVEKPKPEPAATASTGR